MWTTITFMIIGILVGAFIGFVAGVGVWPIGAGWLIGMFTGVAWAYKNGESLNGED